MSCLTRLTKYIFFDLLQEKEEQILKEEEEKNYFHTRSLNMGSVCL